MDLRGIGVKQQQPGQRLFRAGLMAAIRAVFLDRGQCRLIGGKQSMRIEQLVRCRLAGYHSASQSMQSIHCASTHIAHHSFKPAVRPPLARMQPSPARS